MIDVNQEVLFYDIKCEILQIGPLWLEVCELQSRFVCSNQRQYFIFFSTSNNLLLKKTTHNLFVLRYFKINIYINKLLNFLFHAFRSSGKTHLGISSNENYLRKKSIGYIYKMEGTTKENTTKGYTLYSGSLCGKRTVRFRSVFFFFFVECKYFRVQCLDFWKFLKNGRPWWTEMHRIFNHY